MELEWWLVVTGISIDIVGVIVLFVTTSTRRIEAETATEMFRQSLEESKSGEWVHQESYEEIDQRVRSSESEVKWNRRLQQSALLVIVVGFLLQLLGKLLE